MKRVLLPMATAILFAVAAFAQTSSQGTTSNPNSSPTMQEQQQGQMGNNGSMGNAEKPAMKNHKMEGCVEQENGQYVLETRHGKQIPLTGQDVASHVGQTVRVMGTWAHNGAMSGSENGTSSNSGESAFDVSSVHMISQTCKMEHKSGTSNGSSAQPQ